jgi:hypothetical protein
MREIEGAAAIAVVDERKPGELLLARGYSSPLFVLQTKRYVLWASTPETITAAYEKHIGALPRRAKITSLAPGVALHFVDGKVTRLKFKPYSPPKMTKWFGGKEVLPWKDSSTEKSVTDWALGSSSPDEDVMDCDLCGTATPWDRVEYVNDADGYTWHICRTCNPKDLLDDDLVSDQVDWVNRAILERG